MQLIFKYYKNTNNLLVNYRLIRKLSLLQEVSIMSANDSKDDKNDDKNNPNDSGPSSSSQEKPEKSDLLSIEKIRQYLAEKLKFTHTDDDDSDSNRSQVLDSVNIEGVIKHWKKGGFKKIVCLTGAGISTSAGIPDFRSPSTGLYHNLMKYNLPYPEAIFDLDYFKENPQPFFRLAKELYPGTFKPTPSHYFIKLLDDKGLLIRHYTQNIDTLERIAKISEDKIVEAHGTFYTNHCMNSKCRAPYTMEWVKEEIFKDNVPTCKHCNSVVKPDIVFFSENLPDKFYQLPNQDFKECDLLIIMGTSLNVQPFASLVDYASDSCVRLLINREKVGKQGHNFFRTMLFGEGLCFDLPGNRRDVVYEGDCDEGCFYLADQLGFGDELRDLIKTEHAKIDAEESKKNEAEAKSVDLLPKVEKPEPEEKDDAEDATKEPEEVEETKLLQKDENIEKGKI